MEASPDFNSSNDLPDHSLAFFWFFVVLWTFARNFFTLIKHFIRTATFFFFHVLCLKESPISFFFLVQIKKVIDFLSLNLLYSTKIILVLLGVTFVVCLIVFILFENILGIFTGRVNLKENLLIIKLLKTNSAESIGLNNGTKLGEKEFFILYIKTFIGQI